MMEAGGKVEFVLDALFHNTERTSLTTIVDGK
jgi:hypothetical protein